jgi:hypothetical protein
VITARVNKVASSAVKGSAVKSSAVKGRVVRARKVAAKAKPQPLSGAESKRLVAHD